ncbi:MAG: serine/threonine protein kinase [Bacteroidales bacterium]|nr:serine/threonine protein kinase [Bacteroidales bacterium]
METSEFIRPAQSREALALTPVSSGATCETFKFQRWNKWFLLKRLRPELRHDPAAVSAFEKEFDLGIHLDHPGIVRYFEKGTDAEGIYLVEEYIDGETLDAFVQSSDPLPDNEVRRIFGEMADAVGYLHEMGIVHADLKPDNVIITRQGHHPKLIDLGFSGQYSYESLSDKDRDTRSDVYALGQMLEVLAPGRFRKVLRKATASDPDRRYPTPASMAAALKRKPGRAIAAIFAGLLVLAAFCYLFLRTTPPAAPEVDPLNDFRTECLQATDALIVPFDASFETVDENNYGPLLREYQSIFNTLKDRQDSLVNAWSEKYPDRASDISHIANEEFGTALGDTRFQRETVRWQQKDRAEMGLD